MSYFLKKDGHNVYCYAYSPPGCMVSVEGIGIFEEFCTSVVLADDFIPRTSWNSLCRLRGKVESRLNRTFKSKWSVMKDILTWKYQDDTDLEVGNDSIQTDVPEMFIPGRVIHITKQVPSDAEDDRPSATLLSKRLKYQAKLKSHHDFKDIKLAITMGTDHLPNVLGKVLANIQSNL